MKILAISTYRLPTLDHGSNGLGRFVYDFIRHFRDKWDYSFEIFCHPQSDFEWQDIVTHEYTNPIRDLGKIYTTFRNGNFDLIMDFTHGKILSNAYRYESLPILNYIMDEECRYNPSNCVVANNYQAKRFPQSLVVPIGINLDNFPLVENKKNYLSFCGKIELRKGYDIALRIAESTNHEIRFAGPNMDGNAPSLPNWLGEIKDHKILCKHIGESKCLLYPSRSEAGGLAILEAMAMGTPTITIAGTGTSCHVKHEITGFIANNMEEAIEYVNRVGELSPVEIRKYCEREFDIFKNYEILNQSMLDVKNGKRW